MLHFRQTKTLLAACVAGGAFMAASLQAATPENFEIQLKASIPSDEFHVRPVDSGWINEEQEMQFDIGTQKLQAVEKLFQYKNTAGGIKASLSNTNAQGNAQLFNSNQSIPLKVTFNGNTVNNTGTTVVTAAEAKDGGRSNLRITTLSDTALDLNTYAGEYTGIVNITFEPEVSSGG